MLLEWIGYRSLTVERREESSDAHDPRVAIAEPLGRREEREDGIEVMATGCVARECGTLQPVGPGPSFGVGNGAGPHMPQHLTGSSTGVSMLAHGSECTPQREDARACLTGWLSDIMRGVRVGNRLGEEVARRRPFLEAALTLIDLHTARNESYIEELAKKWVTK